MRRAGDILCATILQLQPQILHPADFAMPTPVTLIQRPSNPVAASRLRARGVHELLARVFAARGIADVSEVRSGYEDLLPTSSMKNVTETANFLADCLVRGKRVLIVSDYDCDGATACSVLVLAFGGAGMNFGYMVPDRMVHGYGLTPAIVEEAAAMDPKPDVIITVDNGISSHAGVDRANALGIEVIVTDHHLAPDTLPKAKLIVNPNQPGCAFESKNIAGCGVAWYVARAFLEELAARDMDTGFEPAELLSYVAIGTVADVVKLDRNNRILVAEGLKYIRQQHCAPGVIALAALSGKNIRKLTCSEIGFGIGPRINAAGRLAHMGAGIECLTSLDARTAADLANQLHATNEERKEIQREIEDKAIDQAIQLASQQGATGPQDGFGHRSLLVFHPEWHEGVVGIVAGRLKEDRHRPTIVMTMAQDGTIKGSGRSIPGFHIKHALDEINIKHPGILLKFGGHAMAAGMSIASDRLEDFREAFEAVCCAGLTPEMMQKKLAHDGELSERFVNLETVDILSQEVWGQGFEEPVFLNSFSIDEVKRLSKDKHLKLKGRIGETTLDLMAFNQGDLADCIPKELTVAYKLNANTFLGECSLQAMVELMPESMNPSLSATMREKQAKSPSSPGPEGSHEGGHEGDCATTTAPDRVLLAPPAVVAVALESVRVAANDSPPAPPARRPRRLSSR